MNKLVISKNTEGICLSFSWLTASLLFILFFTSLNGFFDSIDYEYGASHFWECTFLGEPPDLHADLIKGPLSLATETPPDLWDWSPQYQRFYEHNNYGKLEAISQGTLTQFHIAPFTLLILTVLLQAILTTSPSFIACSFYLVSWALLWSACWRFIAGHWERIFAFFVLTFSYPFMFMLTRGNIGAVIVGFLLIFYIYSTCNQRHLVIAAICLAIACNIRPNAILLAPLFLCFGLRRSIGASVLFLTIAGALTSISYVIAVKIYPGYSITVALQALDNYQRLYVVGPSGDGNNNSAYGAVKLLYTMFIEEPSANFLLTVNKVILFVSAGLIAFASYEFWRGRLPAYYFAFVLTCLYILASTIFCTYHLLVLYAFILMAGSKPAEGGPFPTLLLFMSALMLIPKSYIYLFPNVSCEVILNPLILVLCISWILFFKFPAWSVRQTKRNS